MTVIIHRLAILILCLMRFHVRAATERYIIYPKEELPLKQRQIFTEELNKLAGPEGNVYTSIRRPGSRSEKIRFWCADLTETAYKVLLEDRNVLEIHVNQVVAGPFTENELSEKNGTHLFRPTSEMALPISSASEGNYLYRTQNSPVATELRALSQPAGSGDISHYPNYVYPVGGVIPTYIYHVELGINQQHPEFQGRKIEWLYTKSSQERGADTETEEEAGKGHGTCTASKAVGNLYGASKSATLVVVKMPGYDENSIGEVLDTVIVDIEDKGRNWASVVSISWGSTDAATPTSMNSPLAHGYNDQISTLVGMHVAVVCAAGNAALKRAPTGELRTFVDTFPALSAIQWGDSFLVVGNSYINGLRYPESQVSYPVVRGVYQLYAPGVDIKCASNTSPTGYKSWTGTSFSAPLVAGVLADLISTGQNFDNPSPWWERSGGQDVVWNKVTNAENPPVFGSGNATLVNYTSPVFALTTSDHEQLDVSTS